MSIITFESKGDFKNFNTFAQRVKSVTGTSLLDKYGKMGIDALEAATPVDSGLAAGSWIYRIERTRTGSSIIWSNSDVEGGYNVVMLLQYGHATKNGGWVEGIDFINPALKPIFDQFADEAWREVTR